MENIKRPCPFCGSTKITFGTSVVGPPMRHIDTEIRWYVSCEECGVNGPPAETLQIAKVLWNSRVEEEQSEFQNRTS